MQRRRWHTLDAEAFRVYEVCVNWKKEVREDGGNKWN